jgi:hypothetical protein
MTALLHERRDIPTIHALATSPRFNPAPYGRSQQLSQYVEIRHENTGQLRQSCCNREAGRIIVRRRPDGSTEPLEKLHGGIGAQYLVTAPPNDQRVLPCSAPIDL